MRLCLLPCWWPAGIDTKVCSVRLRAAKYEDVPARWIAALTIAGAMLALGTLALIVAEA
jgi:hypothetical protein